MSYNIVICFYPVATKSTLGPRGKTITGWQENGNILISIVHNTFT